MEKSTKLYPSLSKLTTAKNRLSSEKVWETKLESFLKRVKYREDLSFILLLQTDHFRKLTVVIFVILLSWSCWIYRIANILIFGPNNLRQGQDLTWSLFTFNLGEIRYERTFCSSSNSFKFQRFSFRLIRLDHFNSFQLQTVTFKIFMVAQL